MSSMTFDKLVSDYINGNPNNVRDLSIACSVAKSIIIRWSQNKNTPHPEVQKEVVKIIMNLSFQQLINQFLDKKPGNIKILVEKLDAPEFCILDWATGRAKPGSQLEEVMAQIIIDLFNDEN